MAIKDISFVSLPKDSLWLLGICPLCFSSKRFIVPIRDLSSLFLCQKIHVAIRDLSSLFLFQEIHCAY